MADYNVNMKQWNGTSFDNVLPLAYNAKQLGGQSLAEVKQWVQDNGLLLYTGQYVGTGVYGEKNPTSVTFPFEPVLFFMPTYNSGLVNTIRCNYLSTNYKDFNILADSRTVKGKIKKSADGRTITWYSNDSELSQQNGYGYIYYFAAIGGHDIGATEFIITESRNFIVPRTGRYMIELYGGGGGTPRSVGNSGYTGGSSCQHYDSVSLTAGTSFNVTIGKAGVSSVSLNEVTDGSSTTFGSYSVAGGGKATTSAAGSGAGNYGKSGIHVSGSNKTRTTNDGAFGSTYGVGSGGGGGSGGTAVPATSGAVYLKSLGA